MLIDISLATVDRGMIPQTRLSYTYPQSAQINLILKKKNRYTYAKQHVTIPVVLVIQYQLFYTYLLHLLKVKLSYLCLYVLRNITNLLCEITMTS